MLNGKHSNGILMEIEIYNRHGVLKAAVPPSDTDRHTREIMGDNVLGLSFTLCRHLVLEVDDYVDYLGERYRLAERYLPEEVNTQEWKYNVRFYGPESLIRRFLVLNVADGDPEPVFTLTAPPREHVALVVRSINDGMGTTDWKVGRVEGTENVVVDYEGKYCHEALGELAGKVPGAEWWVEGQTVNLCRCEHGQEVTLGYGKGLTRLSRGKADGVRFYTRLFPIGSSRNIDPEKYGHSRLQLPGGAKYVDVDVEKYGVHHHYEKDAFAHIYPRYTGTVSSVRSVEATGQDGTPFTIWYFRDDALPFDPNEYGIAGKVKRVSFQEGGELAGLGQDEDGTHYFEVNFDSATREFEIITIWPYDDGTQLPGGPLVPKPGDRYIPWNIRMPDEYYALAEREYLEAVEKFNRENAVDVSVYKGPTDHIYIGENGIDLYPGRRVRLESPEYFPESGFRSSRITRVSRKVALPSRADIEIGDALSTGLMESVRGSISEVRNYTKEATAAVSLPDIIRSWENTPPTDNNLFSARKAMSELLNKNRPDFTRFLMKFLGGLVTDTVESLDFSTGDLGSGFLLGRDPETGHSRLEIDELFVRKLAYFVELVIKRLRHVGGEIILTPASMTCTRVEEKEDCWRCYFRRDDGERSIVQEFVPGDQARCQTFNLREGTSQNASNRYYWRLVTAVGDDWIELSKADCDTGSTAPAAGDDIVQLGNRTDPDRQNAIILSTVGDDAPSLKQYTGIDGYSLQGRASNVLSPAGNRLMGDLFLQTGMNVATRLQILENLVMTEIRNVEHVINEKDNHLHNSSFAGDMEGWLAEGTARVYSSGGPLRANGGYLSDTGGSAGVTAYEGGLWLRLENSGVRQENALLVPPGNPGTFHVSLRYVCTAGGVLRCGFPGQGLYRQADIDAGRDVRTMEFSGHWDGSGDFLLEFTGGILVRMLALTNRPLDDFRLEVESRLVQMADSISAVVRETDSINRTIRDSGWLTTSDGTKIWASCTFPDGTKAVSLFRVTEDGIYLDSSHINLKGLVTFECLAPDFQTAYTQALGNASMTAKDDVARQLGYANYAHLAENAAAGGKAILIGGYLNLELIDVKTLISETVLAEKLKTVTIETNSLVAREGCQVGNMTIGKNGLMIGSSIEFENTARGYNWLGGFQTSLENLIIDNIGYASAFQLVFNISGGGPYTVYLPDYADIYRQVGQSVSGAFSLRMVVPAKWGSILIGATVENKSRFRITARNHANLYNNNGEKINYIDMEKGDFLELYGMVNSEPSLDGEEADFFVPGNQMTGGGHTGMKNCIDYYIKTLRQ